MNGLSIFLGLFVYLLDFTTKYATNAYLPLMHGQLMHGFELEYPYGGIGVFKNFLGIEFSITHQINRGAAWGFFSEYQLPLLFLRIALIIGLCLYAYLGNKGRSTAESRLNVPLALIIAGALGNVTDFFLYGHVVDMLHGVFFGYDFPVFNVADSAIFIGIVLMIIQSSRRKWSSSNQVG